jgi:hypothetical protein
MTSRPRKAPTPRPPLPPPDPALINARLHSSAQALTAAARSATVASPMVKVKIANAFDECTDRIKRELDPDGGTS